MTPSTALAFTDDTASPPAALPPAETSPMPTIAAPLLSGTAVPAVDRPAVDRPAIERPAIDRAASPPSTIVRNDDPAIMRNAATVHVLMKKIGRVAFEHRLYDRALGHLRRAYAHNQDTSLVPYLIGCIYMIWQDYATAITYLERALEIDPDNPTITDALGDCLIACDQVEQGIAYHEDALAGYQLLPVYADKYGHFVGVSDDANNINELSPTHNV